MELEKFLKFRPENHVYLTKVGIKSCTTFFGQNLSVSVVDCQNKQHCIHVIRVADCMLQVV
jgi:hypothetical protein